VSAVLRIAQVRGPSGLPEVPLAGIMVSAGQNALWTDRDRGPLQRVLDVEVSGRGGS
jgi:hypothetical protein